MIINQIIKKKKKKNEAYNNIFVFSRKIYIISTFDQFSLHLYRKNEKKLIYKELITAQ